jgi:hypothetical protein
MSGSKIIFYHFLGHPPTIPKRYHRVTTRDECAAVAVHVRSPTIWRLLAQQKSRFFPIYPTLSESPPAYLRAAKLFDSSMHTIPTWSRMTPTGGAAGSSRLSRGMRIAPKGNINL